MNSKLQKQRGFTIIEMIIVISLFTVLLLGLLNMFDWQQKVYNLEQADVMATGGARNAMNNITLNLAQGIRMEPTRNINGIDYTSGGNSIVIQLPSYDGSGNVIPTVFDYVVYYTEGTNLHQLIELGTGSNRPGGTKLLSDKLESVSFTYNNGDVTVASQVTVNLVTRAYFRGNQSVTANLIETVFLRNK